MWETSVPSLYSVDNGNILKEHGETEWVYRNKWFICGILQSVNRPVNWLHLEEQLEQPSCSVYIVHFNTVTDLEESGCTACVGKIGQYFGSPD